MKERRNEMKGNIIEGNDRATKVVELKREEKSLHSTICNERLG